MNRDSLVDWGGVVLLCAVGILSALLEVLLVPLRNGTILIPVTILFGIAGAVLLPRTARLFIDTTAAMVVTFASWLLPVLILAIAPRPEGDVLIPGGGGEQWVFYGLLLFGAIAGISTIVLHGTASRPPVGRPPLRASARPPSAGRPSAGRPSARRASPVRGSGRDSAG